MTLLQIRLWKRMVQLIRDYDHSRLNFNKLVDQLEGAMDTANVKNQGLVDNWYGLWQPLSEFKSGSCYELSVDYAPIRPAIEALRSFLKEQLILWEHAPALIGERL